VTTYTVLFFATLKERTGVRQTTLELPEGLSIIGLKNVLRSQFPAIASSLPSALVAVNHEYVMDEEQIPPNAEIAVFPPVSGGSTQVIR
jgi:molybdopterin converting factor subunit 1